MQLSSTLDPTSDTLAQLATAQHVLHCSFLLIASKVNSFHIGAAQNNQALHIIYRGSLLTFLVLWIIKMTRIPLLFLMKGPGQRTRNTPFRFFLDTSPVLSLIIHGSCASLYFLTMPVAPIRTGTFFMGNEVCGWALFGPLALLFSSCWPHKVWP